MSEQMSKSSERSRREYSRSKSLASSRRAR